MNDAELDELMAAAAPIDDAELAALPLSDPDTELCEAIMSTPVIQTTDITGTEGTPARETPARPRAMRRRWLRPGRLAVAGAAAAAIVAAVAIVEPFGSDERSAWAAEAEEIAEVVPRLLITADGWEMVDAPSFATDDGILTYHGPDDVSIKLSWRKEAPPEFAHLADGLTYQSTVETWDDGPAVQRLDDAVVAGQPSAVFVTDFAMREPSHPGLHFDAFSKHGDYVVQVFGFIEGADIEPSTFEPTFRELLASIRAVDVDSWLSAIPESATD